MDKDHGGRRRLAAAVCLLFLLGRAAPLAVPAVAPPPAPTPEMTPEAAPTPAPEMTAAPEAEATPEQAATPETPPTPEPTPEATPEQTDDPEATAAPQATAVPEPTATPETAAMPAPTAAPEEAPEPTAAPETSAAPAPTASSVPANVPMPVAAAVVPQGGGHWFFGGAYPFYQGGVYRLSRGGRARSVTAAGVAARLCLLVEPAAGGSVFAPDPDSRWSLRNADFTVTYCADPDRPLEQRDGWLRFTAAPLRSAALPDAQKRALAAVLPRCYPYLPAADMLAGMAAAGHAAGPDCDEAELIAGVQAALYQILEGEGEDGAQWGYAGPAEAQSEGYVRPAAQSRDDAAQDIHAVRDYVLALAADAGGTEADGAADGEVYALADWRVTCAPDGAGLQNVTVWGRLNVPVHAAADPTSGEPDRVELTLTGPDVYETRTLTAGEQEFTFTLSGLPAGAALTLSGSYTMAGFPEVYYYEGPPGTQPQLGVRMGSRQGVFFHDLPPLCANGSVTVEKQWMIGQEFFKAGHTAADWRTYHDFVRRTYGLDLPDSVTVQLLANGDPCGAPVVLHAEQGWRHTWSDLPLYDAAGRSIAYGMAEPGAGGGFRTDVYCSPRSDGTAGYLLLLSNYYIPCDPAAPVQARAVWADGAPHPGDTVPVRLYADGARTADAVLAQSEDFAHAFGALPALALGIDYGNVFDGPAGVAPLVRRQPVGYRLEADAPPGYTAAVSEALVTLPCAESAFNAGPSRAVQVLLGTPGRALMLQTDAAGHLTVTTAEPDPGDLRQQWAAYRGHLYNLYALVFGAQAGLAQALDWTVGELCLTDDGPRFVQSGAPGADGPLCWRDGRLCSRDETRSLALAADGGCTVAGPGGGCPVQMQTLGRQFTVTLTPLPTPTPTPTPTPSPTPTPTPTPVPSSTPQPPSGAGPKSGSPAPTAAPPPGAGHDVPAAPTAAPAPVPSPTPAPASRQRLPPATGDGSPLGGWLAAFLTSLLALWRLRRRKH